MSNFLVGTNTADVQLDKFSGNASTVAFTLSVPSSTFSALVRISGVVQTPTDDFSISGTAITFTSSPPSGSNNIVVTYTKAAQLGVPNDASVSADKLASNAVTTSKILDANITTSKILDANITTSKLQDNSVSLAKLSGGTANKFLGYNGSGDPVELDAPGGGIVVQQVSTQTGAVSTGTNTITEDDSIMQSSEGDEVMTRAITPTNSSNLLRIDVTVIGNSTASTVFVGSLFQDSTANALATGLIRLHGASEFATLTYSHYMTAGTVSSTTFKVRIATTTAGTLTFNGKSSSRQYGGVLASSISVTELSV
tara:strand:+ start:201 stop:1133 length:933 start_codon:yes stop_codon:yes gene_type:complete